MTRKTEYKIGDHIAVRYGIKNKLKCVIDDIIEFPDGRRYYYVGVKNHVRENRNQVIEIDRAVVDINTSDIRIVSYRSPIKHNIDTVVFIGETQHL